MNREFRNEIANYMDSEYLKFLEFQEYTFDMLNAIHEILTEKNIEYQLAYGSLLGMIRDKQPIPWDYDADIFVHYKDWQAVSDALQENLDPEYYVYSPKTDKECRNSFVRVSKKGFDSSVLHVDIFILIGAPKTKRQHKKFARSINRVNKILFHKFVDPTLAAYWSGTSYNRQRLYKRLCSMVPLKLIHTLYHRLCQKYDAQETGYYMSAAFFTESFRFPKPLIEDVIKISTNGYEYFIPREYDKLLTLIYGDYMEYPEMDFRLGEVFKSLNNINYFTKAISASIPFH